MKLKKSNCDETQKTQMVTKLRKSNFDEKQIVTKPQSVMKLKTQNVTKLKLLQNSKPKLWQNSKIQIVTKLELWKISIYEKKPIQRCLLIRPFWHIDNQWDGVWAGFCNSRNFLLYPSLSHGVKFFIKKLSSLHLTCLTCHVSPITCHLSLVTCHLSPVTCLFLPCLAYFLCYV